MLFQMAINMAGKHNQFAPHHYVEIGIAFTVIDNLSHSQCTFQIVPAK